MTDIAPWLQPKVSFPLEEIGRMVHRSSWADVSGKAARLVRENKVTIGLNQPQNVTGHVIGDHGEYNCTITRTDPSSSRIDWWQCDCPWNDYAWDRTRKWKKYEGRPCSHVFALYWKGLATPLDMEGVEEGFKAAPGQRTKQFTEDEVYDQSGGKLPGISEQQADTGELPSTFMPDGTMLGPDGLPVKDDTLGPVPGTGLPPGETITTQPQTPNPFAPSKGPVGPTNPFAPKQPPVPQREHLRLFDITAPPGGQPVPPTNPQSIPGANPPGWENPGNPTQFPGTFSKAAMAQRSGDPRLDTLIDQFIASNPIINDDDPDYATPLDHMTEPELSAGECGKVAEMFLRVIDQQPGIKARIAETEVADQFGRVEPADGKLEDWYPAHPENYGDYDGHAAVHVTTDTGTYLVDFTASQFGITDEWPVVQRLDGERWRRDFTAAQKAQPGETVMIDVQLENPHDASKWVPATVLQHLPDAEGEMWDEDDYLVEFEELPGELDGHSLVQEGRTVKVPESWIHSEGIAEDWKDQSEMPGSDEAVYHGEDRIAGANGELPEGITFVERSDLGLRHFFAQVEGHDIAHLTVQPNDDGEWQIEGVGVDAPYRRMGVATALKQFAEHELEAPILHSDELSADATAWKQSLGNVQPIVTIHSSEFHWGSADDEFTTWVREMMRHNLRPVFQLKSPVMLQASGGKIPMPGAEPIGTSEDGLPQYRTRDLGWDPVQQRRMNQNELNPTTGLQGPPQHEGQYTEARAGRRGEITDIEPFMKMVHVHIPLDDSGPLHHHLLKGWVDFKDVEPLINGAPTPFRSSK